MLGLLVAKRGLTWQFPCRFMGQFLPDLGAGAQLAAGYHRLTSSQLLVSMQDREQPSPQKDV